MSWTLQPWACITLLILALFLVTGSRVRADEAFLCGTDQVVYVKSYEIEDRKRTDPCIASHFGLKVVATAPPVASSREKPSRPAGSDDRKSAALVLKGAMPADAPMTDKPVRAAAAVDRAASQSFDYRTIPILNAAPGAEPFFHHVR